MEQRLNQLLEMYTGDDDIPPKISLEIKQIRLALKTVDKNMADFSRMGDGMNTQTLYNERNTMPSGTTVSSKVASSNRIPSRVAR